MRARAGVIAALPALLVVAGSVSLWAAPLPPGRVWLVTWSLVTGTGFAAAGTTVLTVRRSSRPGGALLLVSVLLLLAPPLYAVRLGRVAETLVVGAVAVVLPLALLSVVPRDGTPRDRAVRVQRALDGVVLVAGAATVVAFLLRTGPLPYWTAGVTGTAVFCAGWLQFELTSGERRRQVLWLVLGTTASVPSAALFATWVDSVRLSASVIAVVVGVLLLALPSAATVALLAPRRTDVRAVIGHSVVGATMLVLAVALYAGGESSLRLLTGGAVPLSARALLAAGVAALFHPTRTWVGAAFEELLFGSRSDPVTTLTLLSTELTAGSAPAEWLEALRSALAVPGIVLRRDEEVIAASGTLDPRHCETTPLRAGPEHVGDLDVGIPAEHLTLSAATRDVLALVAAPLAQALHAIRLSEQLRTSRGRVVAALEEERRRVRRDLHDGLGPALTGIAYSADAARNLLSSDAGRAESILRDLRTDAGEAIAEVRRIVYGMRPRALDELGLIEAVRQRVLTLPGVGGRALVVTVDAAPLPELPAAVEVAAYRVAVEALTNVSRHAGVGSARLSLVVADGVLRVGVRDEGRSDAPWTEGVGMASMRERVERIGGTFTAAGGPGGGSVVADLPIDVR